MNMRVRLALAATAVVLPMLASGASAESTQPAPLTHGTPSPCATGENTGVKDGNVTVHENEDGTVRVNLNIRNGVPNTTYQVAITCVDYIGTITTNKAGNGAGTFTT